MSRPDSLDDDPLNPKLNVSCLDFLLIELVPLAHRITSELHARDAALIARASQSYNFPHGAKALPDRTSLRSDTAERSSGGDGGGSSVVGVRGGEVDGSVVAGDGEAEGEEGKDEEEIREEVFWRLDSLGYRVGQGMVER